MFLSGVLFVYVARYVLRVGRHEIVRKGLLRTKYDRKTSLLYVSQLQRRFKTADCMLIVGYVTGKHRVHTENCQVGAFTSLPSMER